MGYYNNPDEQCNVPLTQIEREMARFIEDAALVRIKEVLTRMGVSDITRQDTMQTLAPKISKHKISVAHLVDGTEQSGWWFSRDGKAEIHMEHPTAPDDAGRINFRTRFIR